MKPTLRDPNMIWWTAALCGALSLWFWTIPEFNSEVERARAGRSNVIDGRIQSDREK